MSLHNIIEFLEKDYETNKEFKKNIDKIPIIESIYKGLNKSDIPKIKNLIDVIKNKKIKNKTIKFGNIIYDADDFLAIDFDKIVEDENFKLNGLSYFDEKLVRKLDLHNKNLIESLKIVLSVMNSEEHYKLFNALLYSCVAVYLINNDIKFNISEINLDIIEKYKSLISSILGRDS